MRYRVIILTEYSNTRLAHYEPAVLCYRVLFQMRKNILCGLSAVEELCGSLSISAFWMVAASIVSTIKVVCTYDITDGTFGIFYQ